MSWIRAVLPRDTKEHAALTMSVLFLVLGLAVVWVTKSLAGVDADAVLVSLLLIPVLVYMVVSGRLTEFKGPGGLEARFRDAAQSAPTIASEKIAAEDVRLQAIAKGGRRSLLDAASHWTNDTVPALMTMTLGRATYSPQTLLEHLDMLSRFRNFKFVVFLDPDSRFVAYMPHWALRDLLAKPDPDVGLDFTNAVKQGRVADLLRYPSVIKTTISTNSTNAEALRRMMDSNLEALVVVDEDSRVKGVVDREQVLSRLMLSLTGAASQ